MAKNDIERFGCQGKDFDDEIIDGDEDTDNSSELLKTITFGEPFKDKCPKCETINSVYNAYVGFNEYKCIKCGHIWQDKLIEIDSIKKRKELLSS